MFCREQFPQYVPIIEEKRNKKNDSRVTFSVPTKVYGHKQIHSMSVNDQENQLFQNQSLIQQPSQPQNNQGLLSPRLQEKLNNPKYQEMIEKARETLNRRLLQKQQSLDKAFSKLKNEIKSERKRTNKRNQSSLFKHHIKSEQDVLGLKTPQMTMNQEQLINNLNQRSNSVMSQTKNTQINSSQEKFCQQNYQDLSQQYAQDQQLMLTLKSQNFHISGPNHSFVQVRPQTSGALGQTQLQQYQNMRPQTSGSKMQYQNSQGHYRTSFQEQYFQKSIDKKFIQDAQAIHSFMKKGNISFHQTIDPSQNLGEVQEKQAGPNSARITHYDNINFEKHLPFKDDDNTNQLRFNTNYKSLYQIRQDKSQLIKNYQNNNDLNQFYMDRILRENHYLGRCNQQDLEDHLKSEKQVRYCRSKEQRQEIKQEIVEGIAPPQLREEFKEKIERQNFQVKQPEVSGGDIFFEDMSRKSYSLGQAKDFNQMFKTNTNGFGITNKSGLSFGKGPVINGGPTQIISGQQDLKFNVSVKEFKDLNYQDKMYNQRKTNFSMGTTNIEASQKPEISIQQEQVQQTTIMNNSMASTIKQQDNRQPIQTISPSKYSIVHSPPRQQLNHNNANSTTSVLQQALNKSQEAGSRQIYSSQQARPQASQIGSQQQQNHQRSILLNSINAPINSNNSILQSNLLGNQNNLAKTPKPHLQKISRIQGNFKFEEQICDYLCYFALQ